MNNHAKPLKPKRKKPFAATRESVKSLEADGWTCWVVESRIPNTWITRDAYGFADILAMSPGRGIMLVQATAGESTSNYHARIAKIRHEARAGIWLASGGRIQVHSWEKPKTGRFCRVLEITKATLEL